MEEVERRGFKGKCSSSCHSSSEVKIGGGAALKYNHNDFEGNKKFVKWMREQPYLHAHRGSTFIVVISLFFIDRRKFINRK